MGRPRKTINECLRNRVASMEAFSPAPVTPPKKPKRLPAAVSKTWDELIGKLDGLVGESDAMAFLALCNWSVEHARLQAKLRSLQPGTKEHGVILASTAKAWTPLSQLLTRFGLDPLSRERIAPPPPIDTADPRARFFP